MPEATTTVLIGYRAQPGKADVAARELGALIATVVATEPDCRGIRLYQDPSDPTRILLYERWTSREAYLGDHLHTSHLEAFKARAPEFLAGPPEITFWSLRAEERPDHD